MLSIKRVAKTILSLLPLGIVASAVLGCRNLGAGMGGGTGNAGGAASKGVVVRIAMPGQVQEARSAMPDFANTDFVFAGTITASGATPSGADFKAATYNSTDKTVTFALDVSTEARANYVLGVYAFPSGTTLGTSTAASAAALCGTTTVTVPANASSITISDPIPMQPNTTGKGNVELAITIPTGYTLACNNASFSYDAGKITATDITAGSYNVAFSLQKSGQTVAAYVWTETIVVCSGLKTNTWNTSEGATTTKEIKTEQIYNTFYVRGTGGSWISELASISAAGNDSGDGSLAKPYATVQKAITRINAISSNSTTPFTIYVDGEVAVTSGNVASISAGKISIIGLGASRAVLKGSNINGSVVFVTSGEVNLRNLKITEGKATSGGGVWVMGGTVNIENCEITSNTATSNGGGIYNNGTVSVDADTIISGNSASKGKGAYINGTFQFLGGAQFASDDDIYLPSGKYITVADTFDSATAPIAKITMYSYSGAILEAASGVTLSQTICDKFEMADSSYAIKYDDANNKGVVAASSSTKLDTVYLNSNSTEATEDGTEQAPAKTLAKALTFLKTNATTPTIVIQNEYVFGTDDTLDFSNTTKYPNTITIERGATGHLISFKNTTEEVKIANVIIDGKKDVYTSGCGGTLLQILSNGNITIGSNTILKNNSTSAGGAIYCYGKLKIKGNDIYICDNYVTSSGGAINCKGELIIEGGEICRNTAKYGGGICVDTGGTVTMTGGYIYDNKANIDNSSHGGGVYVGGGLIENEVKFTMSGGEIHDNISKRNGGGIYVSGKDSTKRAIVNISGNAKIYKNIASREYSSGNGGGICFANYATLTMTGGEISGNDVGGDSSKGKGIYMPNTSNASTQDIVFNISGSAKISADNDVYITYSANALNCITITGTLTGTTPVATITPNSYSSQVLNGDATLVQDNCGKFAVTPKSGTNYVVNSSGIITEAL